MNHDTKQYEFWFIAGTQPLYGPEAVSYTHLPSCSMDSGLTSLSKSSDSP